MLHLLLAPSDGGTAWRHLLAEGEARAGFEHVGPLGLARRLGRILGLPAQPAATPDRLAAFERRLETHDDGRRSYSASRRHDPFGVAAFLLGLRDRLRLGGWQGGPLAGSARLEDLAAVEALGEPALPPGLPDLLDALAVEVERAGRLLPPLAVRLSAPREGFSPLVLRLLDALAAAGAAVEDRAADVPPVPAETDLGRVQRALLDRDAPPPLLDGDGTFLVLEADTPLEAAELAACFARERPLGQATFVVAAEPGALDAALARQGLPTLGLSSPSRLRPHLQVLPLRLALAFGPQDPLRAAELLLLPGAPLPSHARRRLLDALDRMPGIGSPAWNAAVSASARDEEERARARGAGEAGARAAGRQLARKIDAWFGGDPCDPSEGIPAAKAAALCEMVARWAGAQAGGAGEARGSGATREDARLWAHAAAVARALHRMLVAGPPDGRLAQLALAQLHELALGSGTELAAFEAEAGRPAVCRAPGDVLPGAAEVLWWGFVEEADPGPAPDPWTESERAALHAAGLRLADPGEARRFEAWCWRRPLLAARERAVLARWRLSGAAPAASHPFADELFARLAPGALAACTFTSEGLLSGSRTPWRPRTETVHPADPVVPRPVWRAPPETIAPAGTLSATALESFLGCPFRWALEHQGLFRPGPGIDLPDGNRLLGEFAHRILQDMVLGPERIDVGRAGEEEARRWAVRAFDGRVGREAAPLARRGREPELDRARTLVAGAAAALVGHLRAGGWKVKAAEHPVSGRFAGHDVAGRLDLVLEKAGGEALLDLKLSGGRYRREELEKGRALQLALYAAMLGASGRAHPPAGYLVLDDGQLLTVDRGAFPGAAVIEGPSAAETLAGAEEGFAYWRRVLSKGLLPIPSAELDWKHAVVEAAGDPPDEDGPGRREPPCAFCRFGAVCRAGIGEERAP
jgi:hypothetical protein